MQISIVLGVAFGGAIGAVMRYLLSMSIYKLLGGGFAYGTLGVNILGSLIIGFLFVFFEYTVSPLQKAFFVTGMMGALTTFSTFSLETFLMIQNGLFLKAFLNVTTNVTLCLIATFTGVLIFKKIYGV